MILLEPVNEQIVLDFKKACDDQECTGWVSAAKLLSCVGRRTLSVLGAQVCHCRCAGAGCAAAVEPAHVHVFSMMVEGMCVHFTVSFVTFSSPAYGRASGANGKGIILLRQVLMTSRRFLNCMQSG